MSSEEESLGIDDPNRLMADVCDAIDEVLFENSLECKHDGWTAEMLETIRAFVHDNYDDLQEDDESYKESSESEKKKSRKRKK